MGKNKIISREPGLTVAELSGPPYETGFAHGSMFAPEIARMRERLLAYLTSISLRVGGYPLLWLFMLLSHRMERYVPGDLREEIRGIADGSGQGYRFIFLLNCLDDIFVNLSCSSFALNPERTEDGDLIVGRNLDYPVFTDALPKLTTVFRYNPVEGRPFVSVGWPGFAAVVTGVNEAGMFIADLTSINRKKTLKGFPALLLNRYAIQRAGTLHTLLAIYRGARRTVGKNLMAASPEGAQALEVSAADLRVREHTEGLTVCTNHYVTPEMAAGQGSVRPAPKTDIPASFYSYDFSKERMDRIAALTEGRRLKPEDVVTALGADPIANMATVQSVVFVPRTKRLLVAMRESTPVSRGYFKDLTGII